MIKAPQIDNYIRILRDGDISVSQETKDVIDRVFNELHRLAPCGEDERREIWVKADRGEIEDYGDYQEYLDDGEVSDYAGFEKLWIDEYPEEISWYHLVTTEYKDYRAVFLGRSLIYQSEMTRIWPPVSPFEEDLTDLFLWIESAVKEAIQKVRAGSYEEDVQNNLPPKHRTGTIARKDYWQVFPGYKEDYFSEISGEEVLNFLTLVSEQNGDVPVGKYMQKMCAAGFYRFCSLGYEANQYDRIKGVSSPKDQYYRMADGRDDGLSEIDENDPEAFREWLNERKFHGGHPWEVCAGGNSTHIDLYVSKNENGYYLTLRGTSYGRSIETIKFYNALRKEGIAVYLMDAEEMAARLTQSDLIGIVPDGIYPFYCEEMFPGMKILDFINLPYEKEDVNKMLPYVSWFSEETPGLIVNNS